MSKNKIMENNTADKKLLLIKIVRRERKRSESHPLNGEPINHPKKTKKLNSAAEGSALKSSTERKGIPQISANAERDKYIMQPIIPAYHICELRTIFQNSPNKFLKVW